MRFARSRKRRPKTSRLLQWEQLEPRLALAFSEFIDPNPNPDNRFGAIVLPLKSGNVVITSPQDDRGGTDAGAVYLFDGATGNLISSLIGSSAGDRIGNDGVFEVGFGNFLVRSLQWDDGVTKDVGAITWGSGQTGVNGSVSSQNSLIGSTSGDQIGFDGIEVLTNGNYVVRSSSKWDNGTASDAGAITWGNGNLGIRGAVSASNSLVGSRAGDKVGSDGIVQLSNGNFVVRSSLWDSGTTVDVGAATWVSGISGASGPISSSNSLVGSRANDKVSLDGVTALANGNFVVTSSTWDNGTVTDAGAATWGNGTSGIQGVVSASNSYIGGQSNAKIGTGGVTPLTNGNYVVLTLSGFGLGNRSFATWGNGQSGSVGVVDASNSLVPGPDATGLGDGGIVPLANGNYVVVSPSWRLNAAFGSAGAITWRDGRSNGAAVVNQTNSLLGQAGNSVGSGGVVELANGNFVVLSPNWQGNTGAVTWGSGTAGVSGVVDESNSLLGSLRGDQVGQGGVVPLANGNYVVVSTKWSHGSISNVGAVTWRSGAWPDPGFVSGDNSLIGSTANDAVGSGGVKRLANGNFVVLSPKWNNGTAALAGAVTWGDGLAGITGVVQATNSLVGTRDQEGAGSGGITELSNGNYVIISPAGTGAVTWADGKKGVAGAISSSNSLVGTQRLDQVGSAGVVALANGNYVVRSPIWGSGGGAVTFGNGTSGTFGTVTHANSLTGKGTEAVGGGPVLALGNGNYVVATSKWFPGNLEPERGAVTLGSGSRGIQGPVSASNSIVGLANFSNLQAVVLDDFNQNFYAIFLNENGGKVRVGSQDIASISVSIEVNRLPEGNSGVTPFVFKLTRRGNVDESVTVTYAVSGTGAAAANEEDFGGQFPTGSVTVEAGRVSQTFSIEVRGDRSFELDESFVVTLLSVSDSSVLQTATAVGTILDDDLGTDSFLVTNTNDSGTGSLRDALNRANAAPDRNRIVFNIPGSGVQTISPGSFLPEIVYPTDIDATSQPGYIGIPLIELNGTDAGSNSFGLFITGGNSSVKGMVINRFSRDAIGLYLGGGNIIEGNFLGTDATGTQARGNTYRGVGIYESADNRIGGSSPLQRNVISGNLAQGIFIYRPASSGNHISGNFIGTDLTGSVAIGNANDGVQLDAGAHSNAIGTNGDGLDDAAEQNIISGNRDEGIHIYGTGSDGNVVAGNLIGLSIDGSTALSNGTIGVLVGGGSKHNRIGTNGDGQSDLLERNVLSGNALAGLWLSEVGTQENWAAGNFIGTDKTGSVAVPNNYGVVINNGVKSNLLGTNLDGSNDSVERNIISGNKLDGVFIQTAGTENNRVAGNYIGTTADGMAGLPNRQRGISIHPAAANNLIGGTEPVAANIIAYNLGTGITIDGPTTLGNALRGNLIFANGGLGIDLNSDGVTPNDLRDSDPGPNSLQNYPVVLSAIQYSDRLRLEAQLESTPETLFELEFFANEAAEVSEHGQGQQFVGRASVTTDSTGKGALNLELPAIFPAGAYLTATATSPQGNTSEFSRHLRLQRAELTLSLSTNLVTEQQSTLSGTVTRNTPSTSELTITLESSDSSAATVPATIIIPAGQHSATFEIAVVNDPVADGDQLTTIAASASGFTSSQAQLAVHDDDVPVIRLTLNPESVTESDGQAVATVTRNTPVASALLVSLNSSVPGSVSVPASVIIPAGMTAVEFVVLVLDDSVADGTQSVTITPSADEHLPIDAVLTVVDNEVPELTLTLAASQLNEDGSTTATVTRNTPTTTSLSVNLASSDVTAATVPESVIIPAGATSITFTVSAVNDLLVDADQQTIITASASSFVAAAVPLTILNDDAATLAVTLLATSMNENGGATTGTITLNAPATQDLVIHLQSSDLTAVTLPKSVTILGGSLSTTFIVSAVNDTLVDGDQLATITASADGFVAASAQLTVVDDDTAALMLDLESSSFPENIGTFVATVSRNTLPTAELVVTLRSSDTTVATVPASVTIPAGLRQATFRVTVVNDDRYWGVQPGMIVASTGITQATGVFDIVDDDPQRFWHNDLNPADVNFDGQVTPIDALLIINWLNAGLSGPLTIPQPGEPTPPPFVDVSYDNFLSPLDALMVINELNKASQGEGEQQAGVEYAGTFGYCKTLDYRTHTPSWDDSVSLQSPQRQFRWISTWFKPTLVTAFSGL